MFAALAIDWSTIGTVVLHVVEVLAILVLVLGFIGLALYVVTKGSGPTGKPVAAFSTLAKIEASPAAHDVEAVASKVAEKLLAKASSAPPLTVPNHPAVTAAIDLFQESQVWKEGCAQAKQALAAAEQKLNPPSKPVA